MSKKNKNYQVQVKIELDTDIQISAESFEEALKKAREFGVPDVVTFDGDFVDGSITVTGVFES